MTRKSSVIKGFARSDKGVDNFVELEPWTIPDWVGWLHRQAKLGFADKYTPTQAGFAVKPVDIAVCTQLTEISYVLLGYGK